MGSVIHGGIVMKVRLLESAHDTWAPAGTVGELERHDINGATVYRFIPDSQKLGDDIRLWIGRVKWEEVADQVVDTNNMIEPVKPKRKRQ